MPVRAWIESARQIAAGMAPAPHDDMGMSLVLATLHRAGVPILGTPPDAPQDNVILPVEAAPIREET